MSEKWVIQIDWGGGYTSPLIGPYDSHTEVEREARRIRAALRANGRKATGMVKRYRVVSARVVRGWDQLRGIDNADGTPRHTGSEPHGEPVR